jgi:hypothetical protein
LIFVELLLIGYPAYSQSIITFDEQGWTSDQSIDTTFTIDNFTFSSNKNIYTNYGYNFDINHISIYYAFQNAETDQISVTTFNNELVNLSSLAAYQVSETEADTLIIEGWEGSNKKYSTQFSNINAWAILTLDYNSINKIVIKTGNLGTGNLFDYNFDNFSFSSVTDVEPELVLPQSYNLEQNYPNPFNPSTKISYTIPTLPVSSPFAKGKIDEGFVTLKVYDILGNEVAVLVDEQKEAGSYSVTFDAGSLASGIYIYKLSAIGGTDSFVSTKKMVLLK